MKILYLVHAFTGGGIETYVLNHIDHIDRKKFSIEVLGTSSRPVFDRIGELKNRNIPFYRFTSSNLVKQIKEWLSLLWEKQYDIVHIHGMPNTGSIWLLFGKLFCPRTKFIVHAHMGIRRDFGSSFIKKHAYKACYTITNLIYRFLSDMRAGCSYASMQLHFGKNIANKGVLLNNGIDLRRFQNLRPYCVNSRNIIITARLSHEKNPFFLIKVISELVAKNPAWHLTWVGEGGLRSEILQSISDLKLENNITLIGFSKEVPSLLWQASLFILPSTAEAFGISLIEAQAAGCVCVASTIIPEEADCGALIRLPLSLGAKAWADYIDKLHSSRMEYKINYDKLLQYDISSTAEQISAIYQKLLDK